MTDRETEGDPYTDQSPRGGSDWVISDQLSIAVPAMVGGHGEEGPVTYPAALAASGPSVGPIVNQFI